MWICRRCATHVKDEVLHCPSCDAPAPARLQPELAEHVSQDSSPPPVLEEPRWLAWRGLPMLEKQSARRIVEIAALLGFVLPFCFGAILCSATYSRDSGCGYLFGFFFVTVLVSIFSGFFSAAFAGSCYVVFWPLFDWLRNRYTRRPPHPVLPPRSVLNKTNALGRQPPAIGDHSENITSAGEQIASSADPNFNIQTEDD